MQSSSSFIRVLKSYAVSARRQAWWFAAVLVSYGLASFFSGVLTPLVYRRIIDSIAGATDRLAIAPILTESFWMLIGVIVCYQFFYRTGDFTISAAESRTMEDLNRRAFGAFMRQNYTFFADRFTGSLVAQSRRYTRAFEDIADILVFNFWMPTIRITGVVVSLFLINPVIAIIFLVWIPIYIVIAFWMTQKKLPYDAESAIQDSALTARLSDALSNMFAVKTFASEWEENTDLKRTEHDGLDGNQDIVESPAPKTGDPVPFSHLTEIGVLFPFGSESLHGEHIRKCIRKPGRQGRILDRTLGIIRELFLGHPEGNDDIYRNPDKKNDSDDRIDKKQGYNDTRNPYSRHPEIENENIRDVLESPRVSPGLSDQTSCETIGEKSIVLSHESPECAPIQIFHGPTLSCADRKIPRPIKKLVTNDNSDEHPEAFSQYRSDGKSICCSCYAVDDATIYQWGEDTGKKRCQTIRYQDGREPPRLPTGRHGVGFQYTDEG
jgi:hypothetical protein